MPTQSYNVSFLWKKKQMSGYQGFRELEEINKKWLLVGLGFFRSDKINPSDDYITINTLDY